MQPPEVDHVGRVWCPGETLDGVNIKWVPGTLLAPTKFAYEPGEVVRFQCVTGTHDSIPVPLVLYLPETGSTVGLVCGVLFLAAMGRRRARA